MKINQQLYILLSCIVTLQSCEQETDIQKPNVFQIPEVINSQIGDTYDYKPFIEDEISGVFPKILGKFKFTDKIDINPKLKNRSFEKGDFIENYYNIVKEGSIQISGFDIVVDYNTSLGFYTNQFNDPEEAEFFPVFIVNPSNVDKLFLGKDDYAFGIQEAYDDEDFYSYRPIEARGFEFCGNGRWGLILHPQEFVLVLMRKYQGNYKTNLRVRFAIGDHIEISKPFKGLINRGQFTVSDSSYIGKRLIETDGRAAISLFYRSIPLFFETLGENSFLKGKKKEVQ